MADARGEAPPGFDEIHKILGVPMRLVKERATWPAPPHRGGPLPILSALAQLKIGVALVEHAITLYPIPYGDSTATIDHVRRVIAGERFPRKDLEALRGWGGPSGQAAQTLVRAAVNYLYGAASARNMIGYHVEVAATQLVLSVSPQGDEAVRAALATIDRLIMLRELADALEAKAVTPTSAPVDVIARPKGATLAMLADGRFGLWVRLKGRYRWHEGDLKTMFATVPDAHLDVVGTCLRTANLQ